MSNEVILGADRRLLSMGLADWVVWDIKSVPHACVFGDTGTGKTYATKAMLAHLGMQISDARVWLCDYKGEDFAELEGCPRYYPLDSCTDGLKEFMSVFEARRTKQDDSRSPCLLCFDEWTSFLDALEKKESEQVKNDLSLVLRLGRSFRCHVMVIQQRADAEYFKKSRDNFGLVIALGNPSKEAAGMFDFDRDKLIPCSCPGQGHVLINRSALYPIQFATVNDVHKEMEIIQNLVT